MKGLLILILGTILLNSVFALVPTFMPDSDPGIYLPYQFWFNILLVFMWILPSYKGSYLFEPTLNSTIETTSGPVTDALPEAIPDALPEALPDAIPEAIPADIPADIPAAIPDGSASWVDNDKNPITDPINPITDPINPITDPIKNPNIKLHMDEHDY